MTMAELIQNIVSAADLASLYALFALGIALIFGVMQLANFAHGELIMVGAYTVYLSAGLPWQATILVTLAAVVVCALVVERVAFRPLRGASPATLLVSSFAVSYLLQNLAILIMGSRPRSTNGFASLAQSVNIAGVTVPLLSLVTTAVTLVLLAGLTAFLVRTRIGLHLRGCAEDFRMARLLGVRPNTVIAVAFAISGVLAGVAALLYVAQTGAITPQLGLSPVIFGLMAAVIGGLGSLPGAALGGAILGSLSVVLQLLLPLSLRPYRDAILFATVFAIMILRPDGIIIPRSAHSRV